MFTIKQFSSFLYLSIILYFCLLTKSNGKNEVGDASIVKFFPAFFLKKDDDIVYFLSTAEQCALKALSCSFLANILVLLGHYFLPRIYILHHFGRNQTTACHITDLHWWSPKKLIDSDEQLTEKSHSFWRRWLRCCDLHYNNHLRFKHSCAGSLFCCLLLHWCKTSAMFTAQHFNTSSVFSFPWIHL